MQEVASQQTTIGRNQFKCFQCRLVFAQKDGNWFDWDDMQVHLCKSCEKKTAKQRMAALPMPVATGA
jgi:hypothetical protein